MYEVTRAGRASCDIRGTVRGAYELLDGHLSRAFTLIVLICAAALSKMSTCKAGVTSGVLHRWKVVPAPGARDRHTLASLHKALHNVCHLPSSMLSGSALCARRALVSGTVRGTSANRGSSAHLLFGYGVSLLLRVSYSIAERPLWTGVAGAQYLNGLHASASLKPLGFPPI